MVPQFLGDWINKQEEISVATSRNEKDAFGVILTNGQRITQICAPEAEILMILHKSNFLHHNKLIQA